MLVQIKDLNRDKGRLDPHCSLRRYHYSAVSLIFITTAAQSVPNQISLSEVDAERNNDWTSQHNSEG